MTYPSGVPTVDASPERVRSAPFINRNFAVLWAGQALSILGNIVFSTTLVVWIATQLARNQPWAPLAVSGVVLAAAIPALVIGAVAGVFVDRMEKRRLMLAMDGLRALFVGALILATGVIPLPFAPNGRLPLSWTLIAIYAIVFLMNVADQFCSSALLAFVGDLVPEEEQPKAMGLRQAAVSFASILGPALAAPLFIAFGAQWALLIDALSFVVSFITIAAIRAPQEAPRILLGARANFAREWREGVRFYVHSRVLMTLLGAMCVAVTGAIALETLNVFFTTDTLHAPISLYGSLGAAFGVGAIVGATLAGFFAERLGVGRTFWLCLLLAGVVVVVLSRVTTFGLALPLFALIGLLITGVNVAVGPLVLRATPRELIGRVNSVIGPAMSASILIGAALAGYLDGEVLRDLHVSVGGTTFGPADTVYAGAGALFIVSALVARVCLRSADQRVRKRTFE
ncbi:MAG TPA: MFS transporter [Ktedonobacterales bacterium]|nr:MFS transporter [Ktedonobacterales bacterium]